MNGLRKVSKKNSNGKNIKKSLNLKQYKVISLETFEEEDIVTFNKGKFFDLNVIPKLTQMGYIIKNKDMPRILVKDKNLLTNFKNKHILTDAKKIARVLQVTNQIKTKKELKDIK
jgi:hypothetical protein